MVFRPFLGSGVLLRFSDLRVEFVEKHPS